MDREFETVELKFPLMTFPGSLNVVGGSYSGKSTIVSNILRYRHELFDTPPNHVVYCYLEDPGDLFSGIDNFHPFKGVPAESDVESWVDDYSPQLCVVFDDLGSDLLSTELGRDLLTKWVHHKVLLIAFL